MVAPHGVSPGGGIYRGAFWGCLESVDALIEEWDALAIEAYQTRVRLKPGAREYLFQLKRQGVRLAVATASREAYFVPALKNNGIYDCFEAFTSLAEVERGKGYPDIYWRAAEKIGTGTGGLRRVRGYSSRGPRG